MNRPKLPNYKFGFIPSGNTIDRSTAQHIPPIVGDDRQTVFKIIDTMLTKKMFKDFFQKNIAAL